MRTAREECVIKVNCSSGLFHNFLQLLTDLFYNILCYRSGLIDWIVEVEDIYRRRTL